MMTHEELFQMVSQVPGISVSSNGTTINVAISGLDIDFHLAPDRVVGARLIDGPFGAPVLTMLMDFEGEPVQVIVSGSDLAYSPDPSDNGLGMDFSFEITNMPPIVGYTEMLRGLQTASDSLRLEKNQDAIMATIIMLRYFINGAVRLGVDCTHAIQVWEQLKKKFWED